MRLKRIVALAALLMPLLMSSGCAGLLADAGGKLVDRVFSQVGTKLADKYDIKETDSAAVVVNKMLDIEGAQNPALATELAKLAFDSWEKFHDKDMTAMDKVKTAGEIAVGFQRALANSKDEHGNTKVMGGVSIGTLLSLALFFLNRWRKNKKTATDLADSIENPDPKKGVKGAVKAKNNVHLNSIITEMFPEHKDAA